MVLTCSLRPFLQEEVDRNEGALAYQVLPQDVSKQLLEMDVDEMQRFVMRSHLLILQTPDDKEPPLFETNPLLKTIFLCSNSIPAGSPGRDIKVYIPDYKPIKLAHSF